MCKGCEFLTQKPSDWKVDKGTTKPFCKEMDLHLDYIEGMHPDDEICSKYDVQD